MSQQVQNILVKYPKWRELIATANRIAPIKLGYSPKVIEVFDQDGLICGIAWGLFYKAREIIQPSEFTAWFYDGQLTVFYVGCEIVINRLPGGVR